MPAGSLQNGFGVLHRHPNFFVAEAQGYLVHIGIGRQAQVLVVPARVRQLLNLGQVPLLRPVVAAYKVSRKFYLDKLIKNLLLPPAYKKQIMDLDVE